jgi:DNA-binding transcriptional LysR family regulator
MNSKALSFRRVEVFRAIMVARSISDAAKLLFISQPAVSRILGQTEAALGFLLFERVKGRLYPTPEATRLFAEVEAVYARLERMNEVARDFSEHRGGVVRVLSHSTVGQTLVPDAIAAFRKRYPEVALTFETSRQHMLEQRMVDGLADIAVSIFPVGNPSLVSVPLCKVPLACVVPANHPLAREESVETSVVLRHPLLTYAESSPFGALIKSCFQGRPDDGGGAGKIEVGSPLNACMLVQRGLGVAVMDGFSALQARQFGLRAVVVSDVPHFDAIALHRRYTPLSEAGNLFLGMLLDQAHRAREASWTGAGSSRAGTA